MVSRPLSSTQALKGEIDGPVWRRKGFSSSSLNFLVDTMAPPSTRPCPSMCLVPE